jgi:hypothetical protein
MLLPETTPQTQNQRIQVQLETDGLEKKVKIRVENHDESLGWYPSGSLTLALHQLPLLEQAIGEMRVGNVPDESLEDKIIPFPGLAARFAD